jgi:hypothetical protein
MSVPWRSWKRLLRQTLPDLAHVGDRLALLIKDRVLVVDLDQLRLLPHNQHPRGEYRLRLLAAMSGT